MIYDTLSTTTDNIAAPLSVNTSSCIVAAETFENSQYFPVPICTLQNTNSDNKSEDCHNQNPNNIKPNKLITNYLARFNRDIHDKIDADIIIWDEHFFNLHKNKLFKLMPEHEKLSILRQCANDLIVESYFIEKIGITYSAKLTLLATSLEEKQVFSFIGSDEATHLQWISAYVSSKLLTQSEGPLLALINDVMSLDNPNLLYYLIQIILEGWGLRHYSLLSKNCLDPNLQKIFKNILKDEALHHTTGKSFFSADKLSVTDYRIIKDVLKSYCDLVRVGQQAVAKVMLMNHGHLTLTQTIRMFSELNSKEESTNKLLLLKQLMLQPGMGSIVCELENEGYFTPYDNSQCAKVLLSS